MGDVPGIPHKGLTVTSSAALAACSFAIRTSIGPDTEANAAFSPRSQKPNVFETSKGTTRSKQQPAVKAKQAKHQGIDIEYQRGCKLQVAFYRAINNDFGNNEM